MGEVVVLMLLLGRAMGICLGRRAAGDESLRRAVAGKKGLLGSHLVLLGQRRDSRRSVADGTYKGGDALVDLVAHAGRQLDLLGVPADADNAGGIKHPLANISGQGAESRRAGAVKLAHVAVVGFYAVVCHAWELGAGRVGVDNDDSGPG